MGTRWVFGGTRTEESTEESYLWRVKKGYIRQMRKTASAAVHSGIGEGEKNDAPEINDEGYGAGTAFRRWESVSYGGWIWLRAQTPFSFRRCRTWQTQRFSCKQGS